MQVHQINFNAAGGASGEANNAAAALLGGFEPEDLLISEWHSSVSRPVHYLVHSPAVAAAELFCTPLWAKQHTYQPAGNAVLPFSSWLLFSAFYGV